MYRSLRWLRVVFVSCSRPHCPSPPHLHPISLTNALVLCSHVLSCQPDKWAALRFFLLVDTTLTFRFASFAFCSFYANLRFHDSHHSLLPFGKNKEWGAKRSESCHVSSHPHSTHCYSPPLLFSCAAFVRRLNFISLHACLFIYLTFLATCHCFLYASWENLGLYGVFLLFLSEKRETDADEGFFLNHVYTLAPLSPGMPLFLSSL